jgi:IS1 family transposase
MNKLNIADRAAIVRSLCEGNSVRATARMTGTSKGAVLRLLVEVGEFAQFYQHHVLSNLTRTERVEMDEIWGFVGAKQARKIEGKGDMWTYIALDSDSKLVFSWLSVPSRTSETTHEFVSDLASRLPNRVQLTSDSLAFYSPAVEAAFGWNGCDYAQIVKKLGSEQDKRGYGRYSPSPVVVSVEKSPIMGQPDYAMISTSYVERQNLTVRMSMRRMTRLTNAFSKKADNHSLAFSLHMMHYNFMRVHTAVSKTAGTKTTPAMAAGITDHVWTVEEFLNLMDPNRLLH